VILRAHLEKRPIPAMKVAPEVPEELSIVIAFATLRN
jgi:hypothetical protein